MIQETVRNLYRYCSVCKRRGPSGSRVLAEPPRKKEKSRKIEAEPEVFPVSRTTGGGGVEFQGECVCLRTVGGGGVEGDRDSGIAGLAG